jgi:ubiquinone biosynthesis protein UbiJ
VSFFLFPQLITSTLEAAINKLADLDPTFQSRCKPLLSKRLMVEIKEVKVPLTFIVTEHRITVLSSKDEENNCAIKTSLAALKELKDPNQITRLIKEDQLTLTGDLSVAQQVSQLVKETKIDWEEHLSEYLGDSLAHKVATRFKHFGQLLEQKNQDFERIITEFAQDEVKVAPHPAQARDFSQKVNQTRAKVDQLAAKVAKMSQRKR